MKIGPKMSVSRVVYLTQYLPELVRGYLNGVALLPIVEVVDESAFDFADDLSCDVGEHPEPDGGDGTLDFLFRADLLLYFVVIELHFFVYLILVGQDEEEDSERDHDGIDCQFCDFWVRKGYLCSAVCLG
jgi:hypothetical protein